MTTVQRSDAVQRRPMVRAMPARTVVHVLDADVGRLSATVGALSLRGFVPKGYANLDGLSSSDLARGHVAVADDASIPDMAALKRRVGTVPVLLLSSSFDVPSVAAAMKAGAYDVIPKPVDMDVVAAAANRASVRYGSNRRPSEIEPIGTDVDPLAPLTPREKDVLRCLVMGLTNKRTGTLLGISDRTVEVHRARIIAKTRAGTIAALARRMPPEAGPEVGEQVETIGPGP